MKYFFLLLLLSLSLLTGCQMDSSIDREIFIVSVADDFYGYNGSRKKLDNVITDQAALLSQLMTMDDVHVTAFISENGNRYVSSHPLFVPVDKEGKEIKDAQDLTFHGFSFIPQKGDRKEEWTMKTVLEEVVSLPALDQDLVFFLYSGHGEKQTGNLITNAEQDTDLYDLMGVSNVLDALEAAGGRKVVFIDACYSGFFLPQTNIAPADIFLDEEKKTWSCFGIGNAFQEKLVENSRENLWIMTAATSGQEAFDSFNYEDSAFQKYYGGFTYYLLKALGYDTENNLPRKKQGRLTFYDLYHEVRWNYPNDALEFQTPQVSLTGIDLILIPES